MVPARGVHQQELPSHVANFQILQRLSTLLSPVLYVRRDHLQLRKNNFGVLDREWLQIGLTARWQASRLKAYLGCGGSGWKIFTLFRGINYIPTKEVLRDYIISQHGRWRPASSQQEIGIIV